MPPSPRQLLAESIESIANTLSFRIPLVPPTVNHYKVPAGSRPDRATGIVRPTYKLTPEALAFKEAVAIFARGDSISPASDAERRKVRYGVFVRIVHGHKQRGDGDNYWKCIADGLVDAGVIHSDARVKVWHLVVIDNQRDEARTEITATVLNESDFEGASDVWASTATRPRCLRDLQTPKPRALPSAKVPSAGMGIVLRSRKPRGARGHP